MKNYFDVENENIKEKRIESMMDMMTTYKVVLDYNPGEGYDTEYIKTGYVFDKKLSNLDFTAHLEENGLRYLITLFSKNDTLADRIVKTISEYGFYGVPTNLGVISDVIEENQLVKVLNLEEFTEFCNDLATKNKALKSSVASLVAHFITIDNDKIANKEIKTNFVQTRLDRGEKVSGYELIRYIYFLATGDTLFFNAKRDSAINSYLFTMYRGIPKETIHQIEKVLLNNMDELSSVYNTYKDTFVSLKIMLREAKSRYGESDTSSNLINRISKLAKKRKQVDLSVDYTFNRLLTHDKDKMRSIVSNLSLKEAFKMYNMVEMEKFYLNMGKKLYRIRNGKFYIDDYNPEIVDEYNWATDKSDLLFWLATDIKLALLNRIKETLPDTVGRDEEGNLIPVVLPEEWESSIIFSDKAASAGIYYNSRIKLQYGDSIGITWDTDSDFDLSGFKPYTGDTISWYSNWDTKSKTCTIEYSGDKTKLYWNPVTKEEEPVSELITFNKPENYEGKDEDFATDLVFFLTGNLFSGREDNNTDRYRVLIKRGDEILYQSDYIDVTDNGSTRSIGYVAKGYFYLNIGKLDNRTITTGKGQEIGPARLLISSPKIFLEDILDKVDYPYIKQSLFYTGEDKKQYTIFE